MYDYINLEKLEKKTGEMIKGQQFIIQLTLFKSIQMEVKRQ